MLSSNISLVPNMAISPIARIFMLVFLALILVPLWPYLPQSLKWGVVIVLIWLIGPLVMSMLVMLNPIAFLALLAML